MTLPREQVRTDKGRRKTGPGAQILRSQGNVEEQAKETDKEKPEREEQGRERARRSGSAGKDRGRDLTLRLGSGNCGKSWNRGSKRPVRVRSRAER